MLIKQRYSIVNTPERVSNIMNTILKNECEVDQDKEHFWVIVVNAKLRIEYIELVSLGTLTSSPVSPREVFRYAIMKGVCSLILAHNHPSGDLTPSQEDIAMTERLKNAGHVIGIEVLDHIIIDGNNNFNSFKENGRLS